MISHEILRLKKESETKSTKKIKLQRKIALRRSNLRMETLWKNFLLEVDICSSCSRTNGQNHRQKDRGFYFASFLKSKLHTMPSLGLETSINVRSEARERREIRSISGMKKWRMWKLRRSKTLLILCKITKQKYFVILMKDIPMLLRNLSMQKYRNSFVLIMELEIVISFIFGSCFTFLNTTWHRIKGITRDYSYFACKHREKMI